MLSRKMSSFYRDDFDLIFRSFRKSYRFTRYMLTIRYSRKSSQTLFIALDIYISSSALVFYITSSNDFFLKLVNYDQRLFFFLRVGLSDFLRRLYDRTADSIKLTSSFCNRSSMLDCQTGSSRGLVFVFL